MWLIFEYRNYTVAGQYLGSTYTYNSDFADVPKLIFYSEPQITVISARAIEVSLVLNDITTDLMTRHKNIGGGQYRILNKIAIWYSDGTMSHQVLASKPQSVSADYVSKVYTFTIGESPSGLENEGSFSVNTQLQFNSGAITTLPFFVIRNRLYQWLQNGGYTVTQNHLLSDSQYIDHWAGGIGWLRQHTLSGLDLPLPVGQLILKLKMSISGQATYLQLLNAISVMFNANITVNGMNVIVSGIPKTGEVLTADGNLSNAIIVKARTVSGKMVMPLTFETFEIFNIAGQRLVDNLAIGLTNYLNNSYLPYNYTEYTVEGFVDNFLYSGNSILIKDHIFRIKDIEYDPRLFSLGIKRISATVIDQAGTTNLINDPN